MRSSFAALWIRSLTKPEIHSLIDDVKHGDPDATSRASVFVASESFAMWHNRGRAKLCRYLETIHHLTTNASEWSMPLLTV